jgi:hypothetical protein
MTVRSKIKWWAGITTFLSLSFGIATLLWADFGMPGWFFIFSQFWFWTLGLPTLMGVLVVTAVWGVPGWTTLPLWLYIPCAAVVALAFQYASFRTVSHLRQRHLKGRPAAAGR